MSESFDLSVQEAKALIEQHPNLKLLDVRENFERDICQIKGSVQLTETLAQEMLDTWDKEQVLLFYCHHGGRSLSACQYFFEQGFTHVKNMVGGIDQWSLEIDPGLARY